MRNQENNSSRIVQSSVNCSYIQIWSKSRTGFIELQLDWTSLNIWLKFHSQWFIYITSHGVKIKHHSFLCSHAIKACDIAGKSIPVVSIFASVPLVICLYWEVFFFLRWSQQLLRNSDVKVSSGPSDWPSKHLYPTSLTRERRR